VGCHARNLIEALPFLEIFFQEIHHTGNNIPNAVTLNPLRHGCNINKFNPVVGHDNLLSRERLT